MIMLDTNILIDLREEDGVWFEWSATRVAMAETPVRVSVVSAGELAMGGHSSRDIEALLRTFAFSVDPLPLGGAIRAGEVQLAYRTQGGRRDKLLGDFLIGGHAHAIGATLITRDPRRYRTYFPTLKLITPETHPHG